MRTVTRSRRSPAALAHAALLVALVALLGGACASRTPTVGGDNSVDEQAHAQAQAQAQQQLQLRVQPGQQAGAAFRAADSGGAGAAAATASAAKDVPRRRLHWGCSRPGATCTYTSQTLLGGKTSVTVTGGPARGAKSPASSPKPPASSPRPPPAPAPGPSTVLVRPPPQQIVLNINNYDQDGKLKYTNSTVSMVPSAPVPKPAPKPAPKR